MNFKSHGPVLSATVVGTGTADNRAAGRPTLPDPAQ
jgi:hypothetical protein